MWLDASRRHAGCVFRVCWLAVIFTFFASLCLLCSFVLFKMKRRKDISVVYLFIWQEGHSGRYSSFDVCCRANSAPPSCCVCMCMCMCFCVCVHRWMPLPCVVLSIHFFSLFAVWVTRLTCLPKQAPCPGPIRRSPLPSLCLFAPRQEKKNTTTTVRGELCVCV